MTMQNTSVDVRVARDADIPEVRRILLDATAWLLQRNIPQWQFGDFALPTITSWMGDLYVARSPDGAAVGCFRLLAEDVDVWPDADPSLPVAVVHSLAVAPANHGTGVGARLLSAAASEAIARGAHVLRLDCWSGNARLRRHYADLGFTYLDDLDVGPYSCSRFERTLAADLPGR